MQPIHPQPPFKPFSRRQFLRWLSGASAALLATACTPVKTPNPDPTLVPTVAVATPTPTWPVPSATWTATPVSPSPTPDLRSAVAIARQADYDPVGLKTHLHAMLADLGGLGDWIKTGARVGIKVNLTGGTWWDGPDKPKATEYFVTHPAVVGALVELLVDAGVSKIYVMDGLGDTTSYERWGYAEMAKPLPVKLVDLCSPAPYPGYKTFFTPQQSLIYDRFYLNGTLGEIDGLISVAKLKVHTTTGVTLSMKNLIGLTPIEEYRRQPADTNRSFLHGYADHDTRLPRVIVDLNRTVPVRLAIIDGIMTSQGGAGPWQTSLNQISPGLLIAGKDPVATDSVSTSVMGFDPEADWPASPFLHGDNHIALAHGLGLGTNHLADIRIAGESIQNARYPFQPAP